MVFSRGVVFGGFSAGVRHDTLPGVSVPDSSAGVGSLPRPDSVPAREKAARDSSGLPDSAGLSVGGPLVLGADSSAFSGLGSPLFPADSLAADSVERKPFLDDVISGNNEDSLIYDPRRKLVYIYEKGDVKYQDKNLKADFMKIDMESKEIFAHGRMDTVAGKPTRPEFLDGSSSYEMDTITYNIETEKARIKEVSTQDGEGYLLGARVKKMKDNTVNIAGGKFTTCDADHPHFYFGHDQSQDDSRQEGDRGSFLSGHGGRADLSADVALRLFPDDERAAVRLHRAFVGRGEPERFFPARCRILFRFQ